MKNVYIVDDDTAIRQSTHFLLTSHGYAPRSFAGARDFLDALPTLQPGCVLLDVRMPDIDGIQLLEANQAQLKIYPVIVMTGHGDIVTAVKAMKLGAVDFLEKPYDETVLIRMLNQSFERLSSLLDHARQRDEAKAIIDRLTARERDVLNGLLAGLSNKALAFELGVSPRTVEMHRANMIEKLQVRSLSSALKIAITAELKPVG